jgi:hypothetical protein
MNPDLPPHVLATIEALEAERAALGPRIDAIELALDNLRRIYLPPAPARPHGGARRAKPGSAASRREALLLSIDGGPSSGVSLDELRRAHPKVNDAAIRNALQVLKKQGHIKRAGMLWVTA